jgi:hypothetical protein
MSDSSAAASDDEAGAFGASTSSNVSFSGPGINSCLAHLMPETDSGSEASSPSAAEGASSLRELGDEAVWSVSSAKQGNGVEQLRDGDVNTFWQSDGLLPHLVTIQFHRRTRLSCICFYVDQKLDESYTPARIAIRVGSGAPQMISSASAGSGDQPLEGDLREIERFEIEDAQGWVIVQLRQKEEQSAWGGAAASEEGKMGYVSTAGGVRAYDHFVLCGTVSHTAINLCSSLLSFFFLCLSLCSRSVRCHFVQLVILGSYQNGRDCHLRQVKVWGPRKSVCLFCYPQREGERKVKRSAIYTINDLK